jgi:hypothetical protein
MMTSTSPTPPDGAYPQSRLWDHLGKTPRSAITKTTINIVPSIFFSSILYPSKYERRAAVPREVPGRLRPASKPLRLHASGYITTLILMRSPG